MAAVDPIEGLLALGVITREQLQQSGSVDPDIATTSVGRLVAVGAPAAELLQAMASLSGLPLATPAMLDAAQPVSGLAPALARALREVPAAPLGRQPDGTLDVVVAEPQAVHRLSALGINKHRVFLALEFHVRDAADRVLPDDGTPDGVVAEANLRADNVPADDIPADGGVDAAFAFALAPPAPATPPRQPPRAPTPRPQRAEADSEPPSIVLMPFNPNPSPPSPPAPAAPPPSEGMIGNVAAPMERAKVVREKYAPGVRPVSEMPGSQPPGDPFAFMDAMKSSPPSAAPPPSPAPAKPSGIDTVDRQNRAAPSLQLARPPERARGPASEEPKKSRAGLVAGVLVIAAVAAGGVMFGPQIAAKLNPPPPPPPDPAIAIAVDQAKELAAAQQFAKNESPVDAIIHCENVEKLSRTTAAAHKCAIIAAEQHVKVRDPDPLDDLKSMIAATPDKDADKAELQSALERLDPKPKAVDPKAAAADAGTDAKVEPKKPDLDLDHDAAHVETGSGAKPKPAPDEQQ